MVIPLILLQLVVRVWPAVGYSLEQLTTPTGSGESAAIYGEFAAIGTPSLSSGSVTVYRLNSSTGSWDIFDSLSGGKYYGSHVRIFNQTFFVAGKDPSDSAYIYDLELNESYETGHIWIERESFSLPEFLYESAMSCNYLVLGMDAAVGDNVGSVQIRVKKIGIDGTITWPELETFQASDTLQNSAYFGYSVDIWDDKHVIVGEPGRSSGVVYFYDINETRNETRIVDAQVVLVDVINSAGGFDFGYQVAIFGDYAAVSAQSGHPVYYFSLFFYERNDVTGEWAIATTIFGTTHYFSISLRMFNNYCLFGVQDTSSSGHAYIYHKSPSTGEFELEETLPSGDDSVVGEFGVAVDIHNDYAIVGSPGSGGAVYIVSDFKPDDISSAPTSLPSTRPTQTPTQVPTQTPTQIPTQVPIDRSSRPTVVPSSGGTEPDVAVSTSLPTVVSIPEETQQTQKTEETKTDADEPDQSGAAPQADQSSESEESDWSQLEMLLMVLAVCGWIACMIASVVAIILVVRRSRSSKYKTNVNELSKPKVGEHVQAHSLHSVQSLPSDKDVNGKVGGKSVAHGIAAAMDNENENGAPGSTLLEAASHKMALQLALENGNQAIEAVDEIDEVDLDETDELYTQMVTTLGNGKDASQGETKGGVSSGNQQRPQQDENAINENEIVETNNATAQNGEGEA